MNLITSDLRLKKQTVSIDNDVLNRLQKASNEKLIKLRAEGRLRKEKAKASIESFVVKNSYCSLNLP